MSTASVSESESALVLEKVVVKGRPKKSKKVIEISGEDLFAELVERSVCEVVVGGEKALSLSEEKKEKKQALAEEKKQAKKALSEEKNKQKKRYPKKR